MAKRSFLKQVLDMDTVVLLAMAVLGVVFLFSLTMLIIMCYRRYKFVRSNPIKFSNLKNQEPIDDVMQLKPLIAQLANDEWTYDATGMVENCVKILKLCQTLIDKLSSITIPKPSMDEPMSFAICQAANRIIHLFDDLAQSIAESPIDVRLMEARATSVVTGCWALALPFSLLDEKYREQFDGILREMEQHIFALRDAMEQAQMAANGTEPVATVIDEEAPVKQKLPTVQEEPVGPTTDECPADPMAPKVS
ncbi:hypothetical protein L596_007769 [Steinernema carpocapsae]|uniref:Transmembrane protein 98 n=1 Tax=Steinernema carpocapsae TaxID=34508 RepID=A0A4U5PAY5_STECR|nr:hypothetical protein L596_007769 [Steinernema carpocapsae]